MEDFVPFLFRHSTQVLLFLILLFVATPETKKEQLVMQLRWIVVIGAAWYFLKPFIFIALGWVWKHGVVSVLIGFIVALLGAWIHDSRQNRAIRREYKTMGAASPAFKQRVSYMVSNGCDNEKAVATVTGIATKQKQKQ